MDVVVAVVVGGGGVGVGVVVGVVVCWCLLLFVVVCCSFRTLVRAHRKRRSTAGHGGFLCHICQCTQGFATPWGGVGWGSDDVPLDLLMLRHALGWGGVGQWWRSFGLDHVVDATPRIGVGWCGVGQWWRSFGLDHAVDATPRIGVGWGGTVLHALAFYRKERMSRIGCEPKKIGDLSQDKDWLKVWRKNEIKDKCSINLYWQWAHEIFKLDSTIKSAHKTFI